MNTVAPRVALSADALAPPFAIVLFVLLVAFLEEWRSNPDSCWVNLGGLLLLDLVELRRLLLRRVLLLEEGRSSKERDLRMFRTGDTDREL